MEISPLECAINHPRRWLLQFLSISRTWARKEGRTGVSSLGFAIKAQWEAQGRCSFLRLSHVDAMTGSLKSMPEVAQMEEHESKYVKWQVP